ncbi:hypothetical protein LQ318_07210 [Aliifodinibius salicampi]|uniref:Helix-turn-helix domain-containing protein n=1 Tax=Fodinibius salicampi TaxID=1920655 RepID=A0ABT3PXX1_9BACT|nr:hypothetical protein [Fodinibius salicampi]MCW9712689.1 hypothetical protein [Fodinibius salicampi]
MNYDYYLQQDTDGDFIKYRSPFAVNFYRLEAYRDWCLEKIILFEAYLHLYRNLGNDFYYQKSRLYKLTKLKRHTVDKYTQQLKEAGYITVNRRGDEYNFKNYYHINFDEIIDDLYEIYDLEQMDVAGQLDNLKDLYEILFQYEKNRFELEKAQNIKKDVLTRYKITGDDVEDQLGGFDNFTMI